MKLLILPAVCAALFLGLACSDDDGDGATGGTSASERDEFIQDAEDKLTDLRAELEDIRDDLTSGQADEEAKEQADKLEGRIQDAEAELDKVRASNDDEWEDMKASFDDTVGEADSLVDDLGAELGLD